MAPNTLAELYVEELKDLYSAEQQILKALPKMIKAVGHEELKEAFETHRQQTETHVERLERVFKELDQSPKGKKCVGMEGVLEEGADLIKEDPETAVLDAGLIAAAQHVEHYEIAGYGSVCTWAEQLGYSGHAQLLQQTLQEEKDTDALLTQLALQAVNTDAEEGSESESELADMPSRRSSTSRRSGSTESTRRTSNPR